MSARRGVPRGLSPEDAALWARAMKDTTPLRHRADWLKPIEPAKAMPRSRETVRLRDSMDVPSELAPKGPLGIDGALEKRLRRGTVEPDATLDLHGETQTRAHDRLIRFLSVAEATGRRCILVITGKGAPKSGMDFDSGWRVREPRGVLRRMLPQWVKEPPLHDKVLTVRPAHMRHGGGGAFYVILRRRRQREKGPL
ncbi:MAG TPA: Smr/MutS family protein [Alphaproteobacteria bacterium]|nr:Smr/MutS family protein [Alphaproteobacteria bacterium]